MSRLSLIAIIALSALLAGCSQPDTPEMEAARLATRAAYSHKDHNYVAAEEGLLAAIAIRGDVSDYWTGLGMAQLAQGKKEEARRSYEKSLALVRQMDPPRVLDEVMLLFYLGRADEAAAVFERNREAIQREHPNATLESFDYEKALKWRIE